MNDGDAAANDEVLEDVLQAASEAAESYCTLAPRRRAQMLSAIADRLDEAGSSLIELAAAETHLPPARLQGELRRTTFQLRLFADRVRENRDLDIRIDAADPDWGSGPRPDLRALRVPIGPVLNFAASNFPFAFSVAGGDTASALAAGCPVVVKAHPGHPRLSHATSDIVAAAVQDAGAPAGTFAMIEGDAAARAALTDPRIKAGTFTGSPEGGRALFDIAVGRPDPIPFFAEMGSVNPVFVTQKAASARGEGIARGLADSVRQGVGQFCTSPGVVFVPAVAADDFVATLIAAISADEPAPMLNARIHNSYASRLDNLRATAGMSTSHLGAISADGAAMTVLRIDLESVLARPEQVLQECFGPTTIVVDAPDDADLVCAARTFTGELTASIHCGDDDKVVPQLISILMSRVGRIVFNGWPTGVAVTEAMSHGGPYPATTAPTSTSVGTAAVDRFLRLVALQDMPAAYLPEPLRTSP